MKDIYQFKITLAGSKPPIWRRVLVPANYRLVELHEVIQACFGWDLSHLYGFELFGEWCDDEENPSLLSKKLARLGIGVKSKFKYIYDFGDNWEHIIELEKIPPQDSTNHYPCCVTGKRAAPPENCGGIWGYENKLAIIADKNHPDHAGILEWMGDDIDPEAFDINDVNLRLKLTCKATA